MLAVPAEPAEPAMLAATGSPVAPGPPRPLFIKAFAPSTWEGANFYAGAYSVRHQTGPPTVLLPIEDLLAKPVAGQLHYNAAQARTTAADERLG